MSSRRRSRDLPSGGGFSASGSSQGPSCFIVEEARHQHRATGLSLGSVKEACAASLTARGPTEGIMCVFGSWQTSCGALMSPYVFSILVFVCKVAFGVSRSDEIRRPCPRFAALADRGGCVKAVRKRAACSRFHLAENDHRFHVVQIQNFRIHQIRNQIFRTCLIDKVLTFMLTVMGKKEPARLSMYD